MTGKLVPEERDLANALVEIATKYGKFNEDETGIWADYHEPEDNPYAEMGVKCGNCVLYKGGEECAVVAFKVNSEGYCRFAVLPDGSVDPSKAPVGVDEDVSTHEYFSRPQSGIDEYIKTIADKNEPTEVRDLSLDSLIPTQKTVNLRRVGEVEGSDKPIKVWAAPSGFKIIDGHHRSVARKMAGETYINANIYYPSDSQPVTATAGSKPAPKKDQVKGSDKNKKGSADTGKGVEFTAAITKALEKKVADHNEKAPNGRKVTLAKLKAVYRRGAGAFSTSHRPDQNRNSWAMARVNAFLKLVKSGKPSNPKYTTDNDLLPKMHPRHSEASTMSPLLASMVAALDDDSCPPATQDIAINLANREKAIEVAKYGPLNPKEPNEEFWAEKAQRWSVRIEEAKKSTCGTCVMFIRTPKMLDCIEGGISAGDSGSQNAWDAIDQAELGYCEAFDFKCAASRTCSAWVVGGPITEEK
jgi:hypothetical protein